MTILRTSAVLIAVAMSLTVVIQGCDASHDIPPTPEEDVAVNLDREPEEDVGINLDREQMDQAARRYLEGRKQKRVLESHTKIVAWLVEKHRRQPGQKPRGRPYVHYALAITEAQMEGAVNTWHLTELGYDDRPSFQRWTPVAVLGAEYTAQIDFDEKPGREDMASFLHSRRWWPDASDGFVLVDKGFGEAWPERDDATGGRIPSATNGNDATETKQDWSK